MMDIYHYTFIHSKECTTKPNLKYGIWVMMCQYRLINCNKCALPVKEGDSAHVVAGVYRNFLHLPQLCYEP